MNLRQSFRWNEIDVLFCLRDYWFSVLLERSKCPCAYFALQLRPILQQVWTATGLYIDYLTSRRHSEGETKLVKALTDTINRNGAAMRLNLMRSSSVVFKERVVW